MSEAKHTPGPWKVEAVFINQPSEPALHFGEYVLKLSDMMKGVKPTEFALCLTLSREVAEANARLIAAAPDLLAACELVTRPEFRESFLDVIGKSTIADIKAAIRKAKGL